MPTIYDARSVNPNDVTPEQIAAVFAEHGITKPRLVPDALESFFRPGATYRRHGDLFRCADVGVRNGSRVAFGFMPVNIGSERTWEAMFRDDYDWERGWTAVPIGEF
jgi:hypothetical protein